MLAVAGLWAAVLGGLGAAFDEEARRGLVALLSAQPALLLLRGAPAGISLGAVMFVSTYAYLALMVGFMMTFFAVRHSRGDEARVGAARVERAKGQRHADEVMADASARDARAGSGEEAEPEDRTGPLGSDGLLPPDPTHPTGRGRRPR